MCVSLDKSLRDCIPKELLGYISKLNDVEPKRAISDAILENFSKKTPFSDVLTGVSSITANAVNSQFKDLPTFKFDYSSDDEHDIPSCAEMLLNTIQT